MRDMVPFRFYRKDIRGLVEAQWERSGINLKISEERIGRFLSCKGGVSALCGTELSRAYLAGRELDEDVLSSGCLGKCRDRGEQDV